MAGTVPTGRVASLSVTVTETVCRDIRARARMVSLSYASKPIVKTTEREACRPAEYLCDHASVFVQPPSRCASVICPHREHHAAGARSSEGCVNAPQREQRQITVGCFLASDTDILRTPQMAVEGGTADFDGRGDGLEGVLFAVIELASDGELVGGHDARTATGATAGASSRQARDRALANELSLELGQGAEEVEDQAAGWGGGVDALGERAEADLACGEIGDSGDQVAQVPAEAIEPPHDEGVTGP
jgi:hypothetical protein